jgi:1-acyl-sn-glycerol-3-phosphate acyltransferase
MPTSKPGVPIAVRRGARIAGFVGITSAMLPAFVIRHALTPARKRDQVRDRWVGAWSGSLLRLFGIRVEALGAELAAGGPLGHGGLLIVSNHRSAIDVAVLLRTFGGHMVSRADLSGWPLLGAAARSVGTIFVDRSSTAPAPSATSAASSSWARA